MSKVSRLLPGLLLGLAAACGGSKPPPTITASPAAATVKEGASATFTVAATGTGTLAYQWKRGGAAIPGATAATYTTDPVVAADDRASFAATVTDSNGSATSAAATLRVVLPPVLTTQPSDVTVAAGASASFTVAATGNGTLSYQWQKDGTDIAGATAATYTVASATAADGGGYACNVTNTIHGVSESLASNSAYFQVAAPPLITAQPVGGAIFPGDLWPLGVMATGNGTLSYQWRKGATDIAGATSATYVIASATEADAGSYTCVVRNSIDSASASVTTSPAVVAVQLSPGIVAQPGHRTVQATRAATFSVAAKGQATLSYQWHRAPSSGAAGMPIAGATSPSYTTPATTLADSGAEYWCVVHNSTAPDATSDRATLTVKPMATTFEASSRSLSAGEGVVLTYVFATGRTATLQTGSGTPVAVQSGGTTVDFPAAGTTYTLRVTGGGAANETLPIAVTVRTYSPRNLYVVNLESDDVSRYTVDVAGPSPIAGPVGDNAAAGAGPIHAVASPDERFLYVANHRGSSLSAYAIDGATGALTAVAGSPFALLSYTKPWASAVAPSGTHLYVACAEGVEVFGIDPATGVLTAAPALKAAMPGRTQGDVLVHPSGKFLLVADHGNNLVRSYAVDAATGALSYAGAALASARPTALALDRAGTLLFTRGLVGTPTFNAGIDTLSLDAYSGQPSLATTYAGFVPDANFGQGMPFVRGDDVHHGLAYSRRTGIDQVYNSYVNDVLGYTSFSAYAVNVPGAALSGDYANPDPGGFSSPYGISSFSVFGPVGDSIVVDRGGSLVVMPIPLGYNQMFLWTADPSGAMTPVGDLLGMTSWATGASPAHACFTGTLQ